MAGAYQPDTPISSAMAPILLPKARARSSFHVAEIMTPEGKPIEPCDIIGGK